MKHRAQRSLIIAAFFFQIGLAVAEDAAPPSAPQRPIPYKTEPTPIEEHGMHTALVLALLLLATGVVLYVVRKRVPGLAGVTAGTGRLRIIERTRLNPRCTLYLVQLDSREVLIAQCGDSIIQLDHKQAAPSSTNLPEVRHG